MVDESQLCSGVLFIHVMPMTTTLRKLASCVILDLDGTLLNTGGVYITFVEIFYLYERNYNNFLNDYRV